MFGIEFRYPFTISYTDITWYPFVGMAYGNYGNKKDAGQQLGYYGGCGVDYHIAEQLYLHGTLAGHVLWDGSVSIPIKLGVGYAFY